MRRAPGPRGRALVAASIGASSIEYGLLIALIAAVLCVGIGVTVKTVFGDTISCLLAQFQGEDADTSSCSVMTPHNVPGGPGGTPVGTPRPVPASPSPSPSPTATP
jgi:Flp pilus assembly pilin Flp